MPDGRFYSVVLGLKDTNLALAAGEAECDWVVMARNQARAAGL
jgi:hypothetical protein